MRNLLLAMDGAKRLLSLPRSSVFALIRGRFGMRMSSFAYRNRGFHFQYRFSHNTVRAVSLAKIGAIAFGFATGTVISTVIIENCVVAPSKLVVSCDSAHAQDQNDSSHEHFEGYEGELGKRSKGMHVKLYQYNNCPFCCKVRAFLDYYGIDYEKVEVNPLLKTEIKFSDYRKVPIIIIDEKQQLNDSSLIISILRSHMLGKGSLDKLLVYYPTIETKEGRSKKIEYQNRHNVMYMEAMETKDRADAVREEMKWRKWVDNSLVHKLSPNIYRTLQEAYQAFDYFSSVGDFGSVERFFAINCGAVFMYILSKNLKKRYKLKDDVRQSLYDDADSWVKAIGKKRKFLGGDKPNLADLSVYGVLNAIEGLDAFEDMMKNTGIRPWYNRMKKAVTSGQGSEEYRKLIENLH